MSPIRGSLTIHSSNRDQEARSGIWTQKRGDKDGKLENALKYFGEKAKEGDKFEITVDKGKKNVTEIKLKGKK